MKSADAAETENLILAQLKLEIAAARPSGLMSLIRESPAKAMTAAGAVGLGLTAMGAVQEASIASLLGVAAGTFTVGWGMAQHLGLVSGTYTGTQWPFLYAYSGAATRWRRGRLQDLLDNIY